MLYYNTIASFNNQKSVEKLRKILKIFRFFTSFSLSSFSSASDRKKNSAIIDD